MDGTTKRFLIWLIALPFVAAQIQNDTVPSGTNSSQSEQRYAGWEPGAPTRGTIEVLWTCLSTIFACSWTVLHLNIPPQEGVLPAIWRKTKWMAVTILYPEFIFSKAVAELQMAVDDLHAMNCKGPELQWDVSFGWWPSTLYKVFHYFDRKGCKSLGNIQCDICQAQLEVSHLSVDSHSGEKKTTVHIDPSSNCYDEFLHGERKWTLTHSYFANMGGFLRLQPQQQQQEAEPPTKPQVESKPITAHALVNCCVGSEHDPLPALCISEANIQDKSKADILIKVLALWQVLWLIITIITRAARGMPVAQFEICTVAFSFLSLGTWLINLPKPKDVGEPVRFRILVDGFRCMAETFWGDPYFDSLLTPRGRIKQTLPNYRIKNDFVRLDSQQTRVPAMTVALAVSTVVFGGLHCLAWKFGFPTRAELMIWMVVSVLSATMPLFGILINAFILRSIDKGLKKSSDRFRERWDLFCAHQADVSRLTVADHPLASPTQWSALRQAFDAFVCHGINSDDFFSEFEAIKTSPSPVSPQSSRNETFVQKLSFSSGLDRMEFNLKKSQNLADRKDSYLRGLFNPGDSFVDREKKTLKDLENRCRVVSRTIMVTTFILYAFIRLILLTLAIIALRKAPMGIYTTTWTKNLPNIS